MSESTSPKQPLLGLSTGGWIALLGLPLLAGILVSLLIVRPIIGVINLDDSIYSQSARELIQQITYAREHPEIRAVVFILNSPGGTVSDTESVYREFALLRKEKPVVTLIEGMAASGGYYLSVGTDYIMAKASSEVGNVGVISMMPSQPIVYEEIYSTGPYKMWGYPIDEAMRELEPLKEGFLQAVKLGRGETLNVSEEVILSGQLWLGSEAMQMGLVDALGSRSEAISKAAELGRIRNYKVEDLRILSGLSDGLAEQFYFEYPNGVRSNYPKEAGIYYLHIPEAEVLK